MSCSTPSISPRRLISTATLEPGARRGTSGRPDRSRWGTPGGPASGRARAWRGARRAAPAGASPRRPSAGRGRRRGRARSRAGPPRAGSAACRPAPWSWLGRDRPLQRSTPSSSTNVLSRSVHGGRHPVQRLVGAAVGVHEHRPVGLDHQHPGRHRQVGASAVPRSRPGSAPRRVSRAGNLQCAGDHPPDHGRDVRRPSEPVGRRPGRRRATSTSRRSRRRRPLFVPSARGRRRWAGSGPSGLDRALVPGLPPRRRRRRRRGGFAHVWTDAAAGDAPPRAARRAAGRTVDGGSAARWSGRRWTGARWAGVRPAVAVHLPRRAVERARSTPRLGLRGPRAAERRLRPSAGASATSGSTARRAGRDGGRPARAGGDRRRGGRDGHRPHRRVNLLTMPGVAGRATRCRA